MNTIIPIEQEGRDYAALVQKDRVHTSLYPLRI